MCAVTHSKITNKTFKDHANYFVLNDKKFKAY